MVEKIEPSCDYSTIGVKDRNKNQFDIDICRRSAVGLFIDAEGRIISLCQKHLLKKDIVRRMPKEALTDGVAFDE